MATLSTCRSSSASKAWFSEAVSRALSTPPSAAMRSRTGMRNRRGTKGAGRSMLMSYCSKRFSKAISTASRWPSVVSKAVTAPRRSISALVARVVPCRNRLNASGSQPAESMTCLRPWSTASAGSEWLVSTLAVCWRAPSSNTRSVKVPPMSAAIRTGVTEPPSCAITRSEILSSKRRPTCQWR